MESTEGDEGLLHSSTESLCSVPWLTAARGEAGGPHQATVPYVPLPAPGSRGRTHCGVTRVDCTFLISRSCAELPSQATIPSRWLDGQNWIPWPTTSLCPLQCSNTHGPPSPLHQHPLCWLKQHKSSRAAAPVQLHSSIQCSLSWELKDQCSDQVKHVPEFHSLSFASGMNKEKHSHYDHGITRCRQYLLTEKGCPFLLEIKKKLLMLQTANPHPLIMSARILIISH